MNSRTRTRSLTAAVLLLAGTQLLTAHAAPLSTSPGVSPELKHSWEVNFNRGDAKAVAALYSPDGQLLMSGSEPIKGPAAIQAALESWIKTGLKVRIDSSENVGAGDIAYVFGTYAMLNGQDANEVEHGTYVEIWRRQRGVWKITIDINATGAPARQ